MSLFKKGTDGTAGSGRSGVEHQDVKRHVTDYLEGDLDLEIRARFDAHLDECGDCAEEVLEMQQTIQLLRRMPEPEPPPMIAANVMRRIRAGETEPSFWERMGRRVGAVLEPSFVLPASAMAAAALVVMVVGGPGDSSFLQQLNAGTLFSLGSPNGTDGAAQTAGSRSAAADTVRFGVAERGPNQAALPFTSAGARDSRLDARSRSRAGDPPRWAAEFNSNRGQATVTRQTAVRARPVEVHARRRIAAASEPARRAGGPSPALAPELSGGFLSEVSQGDRASGGAAGFLGTVASLDAFEELEGRFASSSSARGVSAGALPTTAVRVDRYTNATSSAFGASAPRARTVAQQDVLGRSGTSSGDGRYRASAGSFARGAGGEDARDVWLARGLEDPVEFARFLAGKSLAEQELWVARLADRADSRGLLDELVASLRQSGEPAAKWLADDFAAKANGPTGRDDRSSAGATPGR